MSDARSIGAERFVEDYLDGREAGDRREFERFLQEEVPPEFHVEARRVYAAVREVLGVLAPLPQEALDGWRYTTGEPLGRGGNAEVHAVFDRHLERELAMKLVRAEAEAEDELVARRRRARFVAEAKLAGRLEHPGVLAVHDLGRTPEGRDYFTMPKLEGHTLHELIEGLHRGGSAAAAAGVPRLLGILVRVAEAVAFAHSRGVVHRDIKPANIMVGSFGETYLLDWGLAVELGPSGSARDVPDAPGARGGPLADAALTSDGDVVGTPAYMAPEQAAGRARSVDRRADVYALGACLHEILTGEPPYGRDVDALETLRRLRVGAPDLSAAHRSVPAELAAVVRRALERDPARRYATADEFAGDLRAFTEGRVVRAYESGGLAELRKWIGRNRSLSLALAFGWVAVLCGIVAGLTIRSEERARSLRFLDLQLVQEARASLEPLWVRDGGREARLRQWLVDAEAIGERLALHRAELEQWNARAAALRERPAAWGGWTFGDRDLRWRHENLSELVAELERFTAAGGSLDVARRGLERLTRAWPDALERFADDWRRARAAVAADPRFAGFDLPELRGLAPLGGDPETGLPEFAVLGTGELPAPGAPPGAEDAVVLVLIPGGTTVVGVDGGGARTDFTLAGREVRLDPFLLGKQELSRAQWDRLVHAGQPGRRGELPRAEISAREAASVLGRWDLELPTEAQWERAAELSLEGVPPELRSDVAWARAQLGPLRSAADVAPDALGLRQLLGNLAEFCADPLVTDPQFVDGRGEARGAPESTFESHGVLKGGHFSLSAFGQPESWLEFVRPEWRLTARRDEPSESHGVRVCRNFAQARQ